MDSGRLLTLAGLGASTTTAAASPVYGISTVTEIDLSPYNSTLFPGLSNNTTNLYQHPTFGSQDCQNKVFPNLGNIGSIRGEISETAEASEFKLPIFYGAGSGESCLTFFLKHHKDSTEAKGSLVATVELFTETGKYGFILLNPITNMLNGYIFDYRLLFLEKDDSNKWHIKAGVQWSDPLFMGPNKPERLKLELFHGAKFDEIFWKNSLCRLSKNCEEQLKKKPKDEKQKTSYVWQTKSSSRSIFQGLRIEDPDAATGAPKSDFWNGEEMPLTKDSTIAKKPTAIFVNGQWKKITTPILGGKMDDLQDWLKRFRHDKGDWQQK